MQTDENTWVSGNFISCFKESYHLSNQDNTRENLYHILRKPYAQDR